MLSYSLTLIGALIGFLIFNYRSNKKVFLGDFGSLLIGSIITYFIFSILHSNNQLKQRNNMQLMKINLCPNPKNLYQFHN